MLCLCWLPAALYQAGVTRSVYVCEACLAVYAVVFFAAIYLTLYRKDMPAGTTDTLPSVSDEKTD